MKGRLTKKDVVVVIGCAIFLLANIGAIGSGGRRRAKALLCLSNLRQWGAIWQMYLEENDGYFPVGYIDNRTPDGQWFYALRHYYRHNPDLALCPEATKKHSEGAPWGSPFSAWDFKNMSQGQWPKEYYSSYGINNWVYNQRDGLRPDDPPGAAGYWRTSNIKGAAKIPVLIGCVWHIIYPGPFEDDDPPYDEFRVDQGLGCVCVNRHNGAVNCLFMDFSARKIGLKELWTLKWHRKWDTAGPWTRAGGVQPEDWPEWMQDFKDY